MNPGRYLAYRDSGVDWIGVIPTTWTIMPLKRVMKLQTERANGRSYPVALENIESWSGRFIETDGTYEGEGVAFNAGDILFGKLRPYLAKAWVATRPGEAVGDFHVLRPTAGCVGDFAHRVILTRELISLMDGSTFGAKMPRVAWDFMGSLPLPFPPLEEQGAIVTFLDRETGKIDALVAEQERLIALLKEKRQAIISQAVTKGLDPNVPMKPSGVEWLGEVPAAWKIVTLRFISADRCDGPFGSGLKSEHYTAEGARVIRLQNIRMGCFDGSDEAFIDLSYFESSLAEHDVIGGDVLIAGLGDERNTVGRACVAPKGVEPAMVKADCFRFRLKRELAIAEFVSAQLTAGAQHAAGTMSSGSTRSRIPLSVMATRKIGLPSVYEQAAIVDYLAGECGKNDTLIGEATAAIALLRERRGALISAAVTGKIDVRNLVQLPTEPAIAA